MPQRKRQHPVEDDYVSVPSEDETDASPTVDYEKLNDIELNQKIKTLEEELKKIKRVKRRRDQKQWARNRRSGKPSKLSTIVDPKQKIVDINLVVREFVEKYFDTKKTSRGGGGPIKIDLDSTPSNATVKNIKNWLNDLVPKPGYQKKRLSTIRNMLVQSVDFVANQDPVEFSPNERRARRIVFLLVRLYGPDDLYDTGITQSDIISRGSDASGYLKKRFITWFPTHVLKKQIDKIADCAQGFKFANRAHGSNAVVIRDNGDKDDPRDEEDDNEELSDNAGEGNSTTRCTYCSNNMFNRIFVCLLTVIFFLIRRYMEGKRR